MKRLAWTPRQPSVRRGRIIAAALAIILATSGLATYSGRARAAGGGQSFTTLVAPFTQELYGLSTSFDGGVAFAPDGDPIVDECSSSGGQLHRYDSQTLLPTQNATSTLHPETILTSAAGCGLTNHPDGALYSNTFAGVVKLNADSGALLAGPFGTAGNALGIAADPTNGQLVYVGSGGVLATVDPTLSTSGIFSTALSGHFVDGIYFDGTGNYLFASDRTSLAVAVIDRTGSLVQMIPLGHEPDGIAFHTTAPQFVVTNNTDGTMSRLDFAAGDFHQLAVVSNFASGGFRGDLTQVGPDNCLYLTQAGTRFDDGTTTSQNSLVRICPGFTPPSGVGGETLAGLGDSIAAGHGVGISSWNPDDPTATPPVNANAYPQLVGSRLSLQTTDYAISGACIGKRGDTESPFPISAKTPDGCPTNNVNDEVRRLVQSGQKPSVITLTVGGNDIRFGDCFRAVLGLKGFESSTGKDPCSGVAFQTSLDAYRENLTNLLTYLKATFPTAKIVQTRQYLPLPIVSPTPPCRVFFVGYLASDPGGFATHLKNGDLDNAVADYADHIGARQVRVVSSLNKVINEVTSKVGVKAVDSFEFSGHDLCGQYENYDPYVLGPSGSVTVTATYKALKLNRTLTLTAKDTYVNGTPDGCSDDPCFPLNDFVVYSEHGIVVKLNGLIKGNGVPHPNVAGQNAIATTVVAALK